MIDFKGRLTKSKLYEFADYLQDKQNQIGFKVSARGWCYLAEIDGLINKDQFNKVEGWIKKCRLQGILPIDFTQAEGARAFSGVEEKTNRSPVEYFGDFINAALNCGDWYTPDWWQGEQYYIQLVVEKVDLVTLFSPICQRYHIPIANSKGWSSQMQRAEYCRRFKEAEERGLQCVLLYGGDFDPDGRRISDTIIKNLYDLEGIVWEDGTTGYNPFELIVDRFCLEYDFIQEHGLSWINNLQTATGKYPLDDPRHRNHDLEYVQSYLADFGARKCEANALVTMPDIARNLIETIIISYLGNDALDRFEAKQQEIRNEIKRFIRIDNVANGLDLIQTEVKYDNDKD